MRTRTLSLACGGLAVGWLVVSACSAIVSHADSQCAVNQDCARFGAFSCVLGGCVPAAATVEASVDAALDGPCTSTSQCLAAHGGLDWICRRADSTCVPLLSPDCTSTLGDYTSDDTVLLGALLPLDGPHATTGAALADALRLAVSDFSAGIPGVNAGTKRPVAVVLCNESTFADRAASHLVDDLLVSAIVGTGDSATTISVGHDVTVQDGALLMSPRATADLSSVSGSGLVWRTCGSDGTEGAAIVALAEGVVLPAVMAQNQLTTVRVALVHATDVESTELDATIASSLQINGALATATSNAQSFIHVDFGDPDDLTALDASGAYGAAVDAVVPSLPDGAVTSSLPDVILLVGSTQAVTNVLAAIEKRWPTPAQLPHYIVSSGLETAELLALAATNPSLPARILGTAPGGSDANTDAFYTRYAQAFSDGTAPQIFGVAQAYDALYTLAFAEAAATKPAPLGDDLDQALRRVLSPHDGAAPTAIDVGPADLSAALTALAAGDALALNGASAPLAFDTATGAPATDVQVWCMVPGSTPGPVVFARSGVAYSVSTAALVGTLGEGCEP
jgi:ABC-type branched-subunit amino acid transport system substrate-binding protein